MDYSTPVSAETQSYIFDPLGTYFVVNLAGVVSETGLWGIYLVLFSWAMKLQLTRSKLRNRANILIIVVTLALFLSSTALWAMNVSQLTMAIRGFFFKYPDLGLLDRWLAFNDDIRGFGLPMEALFLINMLVGDSVVIWRAWVLCQNTRLQKFVYVPIVMLLACVVFTAIGLDCLSSNGYHEQSTIPAGSKACRWGQPIAWGISLATNAVSTSFIAIRAWQHRQLMKLNFGARKSRSQKVLIILVESGFIYCLFWMTQLNLFFGREPKRNFVNFLCIFLNAIGDQISGVYPTCIIILVSMHCSMSEPDSSVEMSSLPPSFNSDGSRRAGGRKPSPGVLSTIEFNPGISDVGSGFISTRIADVDRELFKKGGEKEIV
ncbi:hypothetical protein E1B28_005300 [Marasmius oreades]|uniref:Uncharacterized protein n=1 Tax=Marasmius oreades TaxID=181124 RepID=A0A9P8ADV4_9AGAR|nr:uncharacterized protein E1B28_005300 [Marasmius oreades]KAG7097992.1 hypothetical protein E1B28_005300 [Marasmius oreades]